MVSSVTLKVSGIVEGRLLTWIVTDAGGKVVTDASQVKPGDGLEARLAKGKVRVTVDESLPPEE